MLNPTTARGRSGPLATVRRSHARSLAHLPLDAALLPLLALLALAALAAPAPAEAGSKCRGAGQGPSNLSAKRAERAVICLVNRKRRARELRPLRRRGKLSKAASRHTRKMVRSGCFAHNCKGEPDLVGRLERVGYLPCGCRWGAGEAIALGGGRRGSPRRIVKSWMNSRPHREILLNRRFADVGVGFRPGVPSNPPPRVAPTRSTPPSSADEAASSPVPGSPGRPAAI